MSGGAKIVIGADVREVKPALDSVSRAVVQTGGAVNGSFQGWVGNANAVATATEKLERQMKGFASEQRTQGRMARFYAGEIASIIPAAGGASSALQGLLSIGIEGLAGGLGIGVAFEGVKFAIQGVVAAMERAEQASQALGDAGAASARVTADGWDRVRASTVKATQAAKAYAEATRASSPDIEKAIAAKAKIEEGGAGLLAKVRGYIFGDPSAFNEYLGLLESADREIQKAVSSAMQFGAIQGALATEEQKRAQELAGNKVLVVDGEKRHLAAQKERLRVVELIAKAEQAIREGTSGAASADRANFSGLGYDEKLWQEMAPAKDMQRWMDSAGKGGNGEGFAADVADPTNMLGSPDALVRIQSFDEAMKGAAKSGKDLVGIGDAIGNAFGNIGTAMGGVAGAIAAQIGQIAALTVKFIGLAIAAAEASAAETPVVGWLAAVGAGAAVAGSIMSLMGSVGARASGGPINAYQPYLVGERGPEIVVPRSAGTVIPNDQLGGGGGAITMHFHAPVDRTWWRSQERHIVRTLSEAVRAGRA